VTQLLEEIPMANDRNREKTRDAGQRPSDEKDSRRMPGAKESGVGETGASRGQGGGSERGGSGRGDSKTSQRGSNPTSGEVPNEDVEEPGEE